MLYLRAFSESERILDVDTEVPNAALDFRVAEQDLHGTRIARLLVDDGGLGSSQRMRPIVLRPQSDPGHPLINKSSILPSADMIGVIDPARKDEIVKRANSAFEPGQHTAARCLKEFKLNGPPGLLLDDDCA